MDKNLNVRSEIIKILEAHIEEKLFLTLALAIIFLDITPKDQTTKSKIDQ
jgi:hypothetical protein